MSYMKCNYISIKDGRIHLTVAPNNVRPTVYYKTEFAPNEPDYDKKLVSLTKSLVSGDIKPIPSCNNELYSRAVEMHDMLQMSNATFSDFLVILMKSWTF